MEPTEAFQGLHSVLSQLGFSDEADQQLSVEDMKDYYDQLRKRLRDGEEKAVAGDNNNAIKAAMSYAHAEGRVSQGREMFITEQGFLGLEARELRAHDAEHDHRIAARHVP